MARLLDKKVAGKYPLAYTNAAETDIAATFRRIRKLQREQSAKQSNVSVISVARKGGKT